MNKFETNIFVCVWILHAQRMSNICFIDCAIILYRLYAIYTKYTKNPPPPPPIKGCMNCIFEEIYPGELTNPPVQWLYTHVLQVVYKYGDF